MQLRLSVLARDRKFSRAMRRVREKIQPLLDAFKLVELRDPIHQAILVGITDDRKPGYFEEVENNDGFFQVLAGCKFNGSEDELTADVFDILNKAVSLCPFSLPDQKMFDSVFERMRSSVVT